MAVTRTSRHASIILAAFITVLPAVPGVALDDMLGRAKDLYLASEYEKALTVLDGLNTDPASTEGAEVAAYKVSCLLALDRGVEAQIAIEAIVTANPFFQLSDAQASPRVQALFKDVRRALLPTIVRRSYADAKDAFDRGDPKAGGLFDHLLLLLDDPDVKDAQAFADLRTVATGFRDLTRETSGRAATTASATGLATDEKAPRPAQATSSNRRGAAAVPAPTGDSTPKVTPPVPVSQQMPVWSPSNSTERREFRGTLEVLIDEHGDVTAATISKSIHPLYDPLLLKAARTWKFKPASNNGTPTRFLKVIDIQLHPST